MPAINKNYIPFQLEHIVNGNKRPKKRSWERDINVQEKLVLIWECCEHVAEFKPRNKKQILVRIEDLLKE